jgi:phosphoglucosamine mutase
MIDGQGREVKGDYVMYILAVSADLKGVVATDMSNQGFEEALSQKSIDVVRTKVGDRYVLEGLRRTGYKLGGEQSGHIIMPDLLATGDGLLAAVQTVRAIGESGKSLAAWCDEVHLLPQAVINFPLSNKSRLERPEVQNYIARQSAKLAGKGRILIRPSGTEPLGRVMVESDGAEHLAKQIASELEELTK